MQNHVKVRTKLFLIFCLMSDDIVIEVMVMLFLLFGEYMLYLECNAYVAH